MNKTITYNYSTSAIVERSREIIVLAKEDLKDLSKFGATQKDIDTLEKKLGEYKKFPDDKHFAEKVREKTVLKYDAEEKLITTIRNFFLIFSIIIPTKKDSKKYFPTQKLTGLKTKELIAMAERVITVGKKFKERLRRLWNRAISRCSPIPALRPLFVWPQIFQRRTVWISGCRTCLPRERSIKRRVLLSPALLTESLPAGQWWITPNKKPRRT